MDIKKILFKTNNIDVEKALPDAIVFCSRDGKIQWVNDKSAEMFETSKMHLLTSNISDFVENVINLAIVAANNTSIVITRSVLNEIYYEMSAREIEDGFVLSFREAKNPADVKVTNTENTDYKEVNRDKNAFLLKLSNDFKSPLQSIVGFSQAMSDGLGGQMSEQQDKYIKIIKKNSSDLMYFVSKLLELSQTEAELKAPELKTFDIINMINATVRFNEQLYKEKEIRWNTIIDENLKNTIVSDEQIIKSVLQNVLDVILRSVEMGEIVISLAIPSIDILQSKNLEGENYILISLSSSSMLLSETDLDCIFDPYKIVDSANRKNILRAITLACVKNLVQSLRGVVWVESTILKNTSFNIIIPQLNN